MLSTLFSHRPRVPSFDCLRISNITSTCRTIVPSAILQREGVSGVNPALSGILHFRNQAGQLTKEPLCRLQLWNERAQRIPSVNWVFSTHIWGSNICDLNSFKLPTSHHLYSSLCFYWRLQNTKFLVHSPEVSVIFKVQSPDHHFSATNMGSRRSGFMCAVPVHLVLQLAEPAIKVLWRSKAIN